MSDRTIFEPIPVVNPIDRPDFKNRIAASFGFKVAGYARHAVIQQKLLDRLLPAILQHCRPGDLWADFGCGNGTLECRLSKIFFPGRILGIDLAFRSLNYCRNHCTDAAGWICADIEHPPLKPSGLNGIVAASVLQWSYNLEKSIAVISTLLKPGGMFAFSLFTGGSFCELVETRKRYGMPEHLQLPRQAEIKAMLDACNLFSVTADDFTETIFFPSAWRLLQHLSAIGSTGVQSQQLTRTELKRFCGAFEDAFGTERGVPLTYKALLGTAEKGGSDG